MKKSNLVIDVGMHTAEDTAFSLAKGYQVVAVEANPSLIKDAERRFASEIETGRLRLFGVAIAERTGIAKLAVADNTVWSSLSDAMVERNTVIKGTRHEYVDVPTMRFEEIIEEVGVPHYLKVDIEGFDQLCVLALKAFKDRPDYLSVESIVSTNRPRPDDVFGELAELWSLGYRSFKYINQNLHDNWQSTLVQSCGNSSEWSFELGSSGPFGEETVGRWHSASAIWAQGLVLAAHHNFSGFGGAWTDSLPSKAYRRARRAAKLRGAGWFDLHASLKG